MRVRVYEICGLGLIDLGQDHQRLELKPGGECDDSDDGASAAHILTDDEADDRR